MQPMEEIRLTDLCFAFKTLSEVKRPSKRVKAVIAKLENSICQKIEEMQYWRSTPVE